MRLSAHTLDALLHVAREARISLLGQGNRKKKERKKARVWVDSVAIFYTGLGLNPAHHRRLIFLCGGATAAAAVILLCILSLSLSLASVLGIYWDLRGRYVITKWLTLNQIWCIGKHIRALLLGLLLNPLDSNKAKRMT